MAWPLSQDYNEAIQSPASSFTDPELKRPIYYRCSLGPMVTRIPSRSPLSRGNMCCCAIACSERGR